MKKLLEILTLIKKRVKNDPNSAALDVLTDDFSVYEKLKEGYQILMESTPEAMLFEEYLEKESIDLLENALAEIQPEKVVEQPKLTPVEISLGQIFQLFVPSKNALSPLMTWQVR